MSLARREFLASSAGFLAASLVTPSRADDTQPLIIDTHQHLWDRSRFRLPWLETAPEILTHDYRPQEYRAATKGLNIRSVYMEVDVAEDQHDQEAEYVIELIRGGKEATIGAVIGGRPASPDFAKYLDRHKKSGVIQGVRQVLHGEGTPAGFCLRPEFVAGVRALGERDLSFDLCMRPDELSDGARLTEECPDTRFIIDHCGNADPKVFDRSLAASEPSHSADGWKRSMEQLAKRPNTLCKISGIVARATPGWKSDHLAPVVNFCLDTFGPDRVVFGSDWPVCLLGSPLPQWVSALREIVAERPVDDQTKLWSANALRSYSLNVA